MNIGNLSVFLEADYSQIELRMLAEMSEDPLLIKQFNAKEVIGEPWRTDVHCLIGHELTGWSAEKIKKDDVIRTAVKGFNFALVYGVSKNAIFGHLKAQGVKITKSQAEMFYDKFFQRYQGVRGFMEKMRAFADKHGYVYSLFGFRREVRKVDDDRGTFWGNQAINTPIQSSAHTLLLIALALLHMKPKTYHLLQRPVIEEHDALYFFVKVRELPEAQKMVVKLFQEDVRAYVADHFKRVLCVPIMAEAAAGFTLGSLTDYDGQPINEFLDMWRAKYHKTCTDEKFCAELEPRKLTA